MNTRFRRLCGSCWGTIRKVAPVLALAGLIKAAPAETTVATAGPFEIRMKTRRASTGRFPNISGNPFERMPVTNYKIYYKGLHQKIEAELEYSDQKVLLEDFWDALILDEAPTPSLIVGCNGVYLMTEREGRLAVDTLAPGSTDTATLQWIDGPQGRPGPLHHFSIRDSSQESRHLRGGRYLLVNRKTVLDVSNLGRTRLSREYPGTIDAVLKGYNGDWAPRWLSPAKTQYAFVGSRTREGVKEPEYEFAVIVEDFRAGRSYAVPFDKNHTHYHLPEYAPADWHDRWLAHYFQWARDAKDQETLVLRKDAKTLPWTGLQRRDDKGRVVGYKIEVAGPGLLKVLEDFIVREFGGCRTNFEDHPGLFTKVIMAVEGGSLELHFSASYYSGLSLAPSFIGQAPSDAVCRVLGKISENFDRELAQGKHQEYFRRLDSPW